MNSLDSFVNRRHGGSSLKKNDTDRCHSLTIWRFLSWSGLHLVTNYPHRIFKCNQKNNSKFLKLLKNYHCLSLLQTTVLFCLHFMTPLNKNVMKWVKQNYWREKTKLNFKFQYPRTATSSDALVRILKISVEFNLIY